MVPPIGYTPVPKNQANIFNELTQFAVTCQAFPMSSSTENPKLLIFIVNFDTQAAMYVHNWKKATSYNFQNRN